MSDEKKLSQLNEIISFAKHHSPFYQSYLPVGDLTCLDDLSKVAILEADRLKAESNKPDCAMLTGEVKGAYVFASGGTTGRPKYIYRSHVENKVNSSNLAKGFSLSGLNENDTVLNLLSVGNLWAAQVVSNAAFEKVGATILSVGHLASVSAVIDYINFFNVTTLVGVPTQLLSLAHSISQSDVEGVFIDKVITGGEHLYPSGKSLLRRSLQVKEFLSFGYASNDTGAIGYQCAHCNDNEYHVHGDSLFLEILNTETNKSVGEGEAGKIIVTSYDRRLMPIIRYAVGDMGRFIPGHCPCGSDHPRFNLLGRSDDKLRMGLGQLAAADIDQCICEIPELLPHFQMQIELKEHVDQLTVAVESFHSENDRSILQDKLYAQLMSLDAVASEVAGKRAHPPIIRVVKPGAIPRNARTGKISRAVDRRG